MNTNTIEQRPSAELVPVSNLSVADLFEPGGTQAILDAMDAEIVRRGPGLLGDSPASLELVKSTAMQISKMKSKVDTLGKDYVALLKEKPKIIDAERKRFRDMVDEWHEAVRRPLTDIENLIKAQEERINGIRAASPAGVLITIEQAESRLAKIEELYAFDFGDARSTMAERAKDTYSVIKSALAVRLQELHAAAAEAAELEKLRLKQAELDRAERDRLKREAAIAAEEARAANERTRLAEKALEVERAAARTIPVDTDPPIPYIAPAPRQEPWENPPLSFVADRIDGQTIRNNFARAIIRAFEEAGLDLPTAKIAAKAIVDNKIPHVEVRYV